MEGFSLLEPQVVVSEHFQQMRRAATQSLAHQAYPQPTIIHFPTIMPVTHSTLTLQTCAGA